MPGDDDAVQSNIAVIVSRQNEHNRRIDDLYARDSLRQQRIAELDRDKESQVEADMRYQRLVDEIEKVKQSQNVDSKRLSVVIDRVSWVTILLSTLTLIASGIAAYVGHLP